jgi:hypothetical protein
VTIGEVMFRLAVALSGLGYYGCLFAGVVLTLACQRVWRAVADGWWARQERRERQALAARPVMYDDATVVVPPPADWETRVDHDFAELFDRGVAKVGGE